MSTAPGEKSIAAAAQPQRWPNTLDLHQRITHAEDDSEDDNHSYLECNHRLRPRLRMFCTELQRPAPLACTQCSAGCSAAALEKLTGRREPLTGAELRPTRHRYIQPVIFVNLCAHHTGFAGTAQQSLEGACSAG